MTSLSFQSFIIMRYILPRRIEKVQIFFFWQLMTWNWIFYISHMPFIHFFLLFFRPTNQNCNFWNDGLLVLVFSLLFETGCGYRHMLDATTKRNFIVCVNLSFKIKKKLFFKNNFRTFFNALKFSWILNHFSIDLQQQ